MQKKALTGGGVGGELLFWNAQAEVVSRFVCVRACSHLCGGCAARQLHTLSRRPVSVWQKTSLVVGPRAQNVCGGGGNGCQGEWGRQQMNRREATRRWEAQKKVTSLRGFFHPPLPRPLSRRPLSCQRWVTWLLGLAGARARMCVCCCEECGWISGRVVRVLTTLTRDNKLSVAGCATPPVHVPTAADRS